MRSNLILYILEMNFVFVFTPTVQSIEFKNCFILTQNESRVSFRRRSQAYAGNQELLIKSNLSQVRQNIF